MSHIDGRTWWLTSSELLLHRINSEGEAANDTTGDKK
jgi:hypothetical protein